MELPAKENYGSSYYRRFQVVLEGRLAVGTCEVRARSGDSEWTERAWAKATTGSEA